MAADESHQRAKNAVEAFSQPWVDIRQIAKRCCDLEASEHLTQRTEGRMVTCGAVLTAAAGRGPGAL